jgi:hypothetical protein
MSSRGDGGSIKVGRGDKGGIGSEHSGVGKAETDINDVRRMDKGVCFVAGMKGRPGGETDETEIGQL